MKKLIAATAVASFVASSAFAGGKNEVEMEPEVMTEEVMEKASGSLNSGILVPALAVLLLGAALSSSSS